ncbi:MAG: 4Fe-4S dicluster domain-containing protein [Clostridiales bacterium]|nr:4Fe-4S dicluster domain-containing protein [Clostridiales bacterium]
MNMKGRVTFKENTCKGCALCTTVCPVKIIAINQTVLNKKGYYPAGIKEMEKCIACGNCARFCPDSVITVERLDQQ